MKACTLYVVRHGQSVFNRDHILTGHSDSELSEEGEREAAALADKLSAIRFDAVYTSDLQRAVKTAEIISGKPVPRSHRLYELRERSFGRLEGQSAEHWRDLYRSEQYQKLPEAERWAYKHRPDIESDHEVSARYARAIRDIADQNPGKTVLIVAHGGALRALLVKLGYATLAELPPESLRNTGYAKLVYNGREFIVEATAGVTKHRPA